MKKSDEKLRQSLLEAMAMDDTRLEEEMENEEPHVFSEEFERNMAKSIKRFRRRWWKRWFWRIGKKK